MELDHLFFLTTAAAPELAALNALGLTPTYRRTHAGQGTANVCYAFANAFLEVLWVTDVAEAQSAPVARLQLDRRSAWTTAGTSPFGIAWRATAHGRTDGPTTWLFQPPYLPAGIGIEVATASDDPTQPLLFAFPGASAPQTWPLPRQGALQEPGGYDQLALDTLWLPHGVPASTALLDVVGALGGRVAVHPDGGQAMDILLTRSDGGAAVSLRLPSCERLA